MKQNCKNRIPAPIWNVLKVLVSVVIIYVILRKLDIEQIRVSLQDYNFSFYFLAILIFAINYNAIVYRWKLVTDINLAKVNVSYLKLLKFSLIGMFFNIFLPSAIGGDIYRCYAFGKDSVESESPERKRTNYGPASASVIADRFIGLFSVFLIGVVAIIIGYRYVEDKRIVAFVILFFFFSIAFILLFFQKRWMLLFRNLLLKLHIKKLSELLSQLYNLFYSYRFGMNKILVALCFSLIYQLGTIVGIYILYLGIENSTSILYFMIFMPIIYIIQIIPFSLGGTGFREAAYIILFSTVGMNKEIAFLISILSFTLVIIIGIIGGIIFSFEGILRRRRDKK